MLGWCENRKVILVLIVFGPFGQHDGTTSLDSVANDSISLAKRKELRRL